MSTTYEKIALHHGLDAEAVKGTRYQATGWSRPIYVVAHDYWAAGPRPPTPVDGANFNWRMVVSRWDGKAVLWRAKP